MAGTLTRDQRDALRADVILELKGIDDFGRMFEKGRPEAAERMRRKFEENARLLDDLGWEELDERESFELTMPPDRLTPLLRHFWQQADEDLDCLQRELGVGRHPWQKEEDYERERVAIRREMDDDLDTRSACVTALDALGAR